MGVRRRRRLASEGMGAWTGKREVAGGAGNGEEEAGSGRRSQRRDLASARDGEDEHIRSVLAVPAWRRTGMDSRFTKAGRGRQQWSSGATTTSCDC